MILFIRKKVSEFRLKQWSCECRTISEFMLRIEFSVEENCRRPVGMKFSYQVTMNTVSYDVKFNMTRLHGNGETYGRNIEVIETFIWKDYPSYRNIR